jgi:uncharacterized RDD family membrane protein YckC
MEAQLGPVYAKADYAGFFRRMLALLLDLCILLLTWSVPAIIVCLVYPQAMHAGGRWLGLALLVLGLAYFFIFRLLERGSPGYRLVGIRYAYVLPGRPSKLWIVLRSLWALFLTMFFGLNHIWILFDPRKQAWHDKLSGFYVVRRRAQPISMQPIVQRLINFMGYTFIVWEPAADSDG